MEIRNYLELNENKKAYQDFRDAAKTALRGKYIAWDAYIRKYTWSKSNDSNFKHRKLEKQIESKLKQSMEITKTGNWWNKNGQKKKKIEKINEAKSCFVGKFKDWYIFRMIDQREKKGHEKERRYKEHSLPPGQASSKCISNNILELLGTIDSCVPSIFSSLSKWECLFKLSSPYPWKYAERGYQ